MNSRLRDGTIVETYDAQGKSIERLYGATPGRLLLRVLTAPWVSRLAGWFLDTKPSRRLVKGFVRRNRLELGDYPERSYLSFNDFFTRAILPGRRPVEPDEDALIAPCDGKLTAFQLARDETFQIKGADYTLEGLLRDRALAERFRGGWGLLFRLTVDDYHRYAYPVSGAQGETIRIPGVFHTVNPRAAAARPIYRENTREYTVLESERFGAVLMMEIGAMLVGRICNPNGPGPVARGAEKGRFEFGGSSILLLLEPGRLRPDEDIVKNSANGEETVVRLGERIGIAAYHNKGEKPHG